MKRRNSPAISIIVATRNREAVLARFLEALERLPRVPDWNLVVVDNGSVDATQRLLALAVRKLPLVPVYEPRLGKSRALNAALAVAEGELLIFADDDIVPSSGWLSALYRAAIENPDANIFGSKILVVRESIPSWIDKSFNLHTLLLSAQDLGDRTCLYPFDQYPVGPSLAVRRDTLLHKGAKWPVSLGPGTRIPVGDETVFLMQMSRPNDHDRLYVPNSIVLHSISGRSLSVVKCVKRCFLGGFVAGMIRRHYPDKSHSWNRNIQLVLHRLGHCSSFWELVCILTRAVGVVAGKWSPYSRIAVEHHFQAAIG